MSGLEVAAQLTEPATTASCKIGGNWLLRNYGYEKTRECKTWLTRMEQIIEEIKELGNDYENKPPSISSLAIARGMEQYCGNSYAWFTEKSRENDDDENCAAQNNHIWWFRYHLLRVCNNRNHTGTNLSQFGYDKSNRDPWIAKYLLFLDDVPSEVKVEDLLEKAGIDLSKTDGQVVFACRDKYDCKTDEDMYIKAILECSGFSKEGSRFPSDF
ncbi:hypothetical protein V6N12_011813 [Hibiscus sabdariffa]|uniref:Uncharacterized protein n=1 Tax=Hibiscus sabdariffa TaxID=183260 RepID=A0ABR2BTI2_9ROSI